MALTRKKITVRGKSGKTFQRSVMVRAGEAVKRTAGKVAKFVGKHKGKIAAGVALAGAAGIGLALNRHKLAGAARGVGLALNAQKHSGDKLSLRERARGISLGARAGAASNADMDKGARHHLGAAAVRGAGAIDGAVSSVRKAATAAGNARRAYSASRETGLTRRQSARNAAGTARNS